MLVLGIDPGAGATGYGMVARSDGVLRAVEYGSIITTPRDPFPTRLQQIYSRLAELIRRYQPEWAAAESLIFAKNAQSAFKLGQARGVAILAASLGGLTIAEYTPLQVKSAVTGYGAADKRQVQQMVQSLLGLEEPIRSTDAADALAVAICHHHSARLLHLTRGGRR
ncbi:Holliday junction resolvase [Candidatus Methylomirabilis lanthanidiphila]|uniref:Crossover junction endodeoxyribonuclease RuvC n=1 Tax=Candidatus Methylomirabilis lanthanidiphila TaxID=2211376 RepID=A0A564ZML3_9BACT|nr:crossover junction endodeoxyribonuclease RuvC [Candidatus Methylomirabilis lanthanidiphila]VUZ86551.1 Holliday junction resolvase [Candidatus Methylomirabilis lanthanidiphila]